MFCEVLEEVCEIIEFGDVEEVNESVDIEFREFDRLWKMKMNGLYFMKKFMVFIDVDEIYWYLILVNDKDFGLEVYIKLVGCLLIELGDIMSYCEVSG